MQGSLDCEKSFNTAKAIHVKDILGKYICENHGNNLLRMDRYLNNLFAIMICVFLLTVLFKYIQ